MVDLSNRQRREGRFDRRVWPANPHQLVAIRSTVRHWLTPLGLSADTRDDLVLAASEAASNSIEHAYSPAAGGVVELTFWIETAAVCIEITDHGVWRPPSPEPAGRGFGIPMMNQLVDVVTVAYNAHGTRVLLQHPLTDPPG